MKNKRLFDRVQVSNKVQLIHRLSDSKVIKMDGALENFSLDGLCIKINDDVSSLKVNDLIEIEFELNNVPLKINSSLKWIQSHSKKLGFEYISDIHSSYRKVISQLYENNKCGFFLTEVTAYLKDINLYGTGYFSRYFEWQGIAREEYFMTVQNYQELMYSGVKLITKRAWTDYVNHCFVFDKITLKIQNGNIKKYSFEMVFTFFNSKTKQIIAQGGQVLVFADAQGKLIKIPKPIIDVISKHISL